MPKSEDFDYQELKVDNAGGWNARNYHNTPRQASQSVNVGLPTFGRAHQESATKRTDWKPKPRTRVTTLADMKLHDANTKDLRNRNIK
jgi:hypothetical protein